MPKRFHKHKLLLDENMPERSMFPRLNALFDVKHIRDDLNSGGFSDPQVYDLAMKLKRLIVTFNARDFKKLASRSKATGVIGRSANLAPSHVDTKLTTLLTKSTASALQGKYTSLSEAA
jgi:predicted nuclease of predicted toxin-antitoxin system